MREFNHTVGIEITKEEYEFLNKLENIAGDISDYTSWDVEDVIAQLIFRILDEEPNTVVKLQEMYNR